MSNSTSPEDVMAEAIAADENKKETLRQEIKMIEKTMREIKAQYCRIKYIYEMKSNEMKSCK